MPRLATYSTDGKPGEFRGTVRHRQPATVGDCSAHWFTVKGNIVALGNYEQGTRFVDISDPRNPQQVGYFRVPATRHGRGTPGEVISSNTAGAYWHGKYVYVADYARGIDVLQVHDSPIGQDPAEDVLELLRRQPDDGRLDRHAAAARAARCRPRWR